MKKRMERGTKELPASAPKRARESEENSFNGKIINDSVHGHIEVHPLLVKIIDTPEFQRLRNIKQLGGAYWVYPGASHNRFEHSIGMMHLAGCLFENLRNHQQELKQKMTNRDKLCVQIAALCSNLGYGPFSNLFEKRFIPEVPNVPAGSKRHSELSVKMFAHMVEKNGLKAEMEKHKMKPDEDCDMIKNLITGCAKEDKDKTFMYEIVANNLNGIDVSKFDYFARDCHHLGISNSFDHERLMKYARVCEVEGQNHICFSDKEADHIYEMFRSRYNLHRQAYQHKTVNIIEIMIKDAFVKANNHLKIAEAINDMEKYSKLTDNKFEEILYSTNNELKGAKEILQNVVNRRLPKCVGEGRLPEIKVKELQDKQKLQKKLQDTWKKAIDGELDADDFIIDVVEMDHGMKEKNPFDNIYFYSKSNPDQALEINKYQMSSFLPKHFDEKLVRVYYKKINPDESVLEAAKQCFEKWAINSFGLPGLITFYDDENCKGKSYPCEENCLDLQTKLKCCRSIRVESGTWVLYHKKKVEKFEHILKQGDFVNITLWESTEETWSCKMHSCVIALYEQKCNFRVMTESTSSEELNKQFEILRCYVFCGYWTLEDGMKTDILKKQRWYSSKDTSVTTVTTVTSVTSVKYHSEYIITEFSNYLRKGPKDLCSRKMITPSKSKHKIQIFNKENFHGRKGEATADCPSVQVKFGMDDVHSCKVLGGSWMLCEGPDNEDGFRVEQPEYTSPEWDFQVKSLKCLKE